VKNLFALIACLVLVVGVAGCELVIPPDQYQRASQAVGDGDVVTSTSAVDAGGELEDGSADALESAGERLTTDGAGAPDGKLEASTRDGAQPTEGGARPSDASAGATPKDAAADARGDAAFPEGATPECQLACDNTYCCLSQVCCPSVCDTRRCVLAPVCPSSTNVACD
jgi:hypothetical protein